MPLLTPWPTSTRNIHRIIPPRNVVKAKIGFILPFNIVLGKMLRQYTVSLQQLLNLANSWLILCCTKLSTSPYELKVHQLETGVVLPF
jgi:hypothetical protein